MILKDKNKLAMFLVAIGFAIFATIGMILPSFAAKPDKGTTIQSGELENSAGEVITTGYDEWGYNYQARMFNGKYCDAYRDANWCQDYKDDNLLMKWNDAWLSNVDRDDDGLLDRHYGHVSYIGSGAWLTNHMSGTYDVWTLSEDWSFTLTYGSNTYTHEVVTTDINDDGTFEVTGDYVGGPETWTGSGSIDGNVFSMDIYYDTSSYEAYFDGTIAPDGTIAGTWSSNIGQNGTWDSDGVATSMEQESWNYFVKIVAVPSDADEIDGVWYTEDGTEIGPSIWNEFAILQEVSNDTGSMDHGLTYKSMYRAGLGNWAD